MSLVGLLLAIFWTAVVLVLSSLAACLIVAHIPVKRTDMPPEDEDEDEDVEDYEEMPAAPVDQNVDKLRSMRPPAMEMVDDTSGIPTFEELNNWLRLGEE